MAFPPQMLRPDSWPKQQGPVSHTVRKKQEKRRKKKEKITKRQNPKTNAKSKTKQTKLQKESYTHTHKKRGKQMEESNPINKETHK